MKTWLRASTLIDSGLNSNAPINISSHDHKSMATILARQFFSQVVGRSDIVCAALESMFLDTLRGQAA